MPTKATAAQKVRSRGRAAVGPMRWFHLLPRRRPAHYLRRSVGCMRSSLTAASP